MGLRVLLGSLAASGAHVLVAPAPGVFGHRVALERAVETAGMHLAETVADADVLAVVGDPGPRLMALIDHVWEQMSEPRTRVRVREGDDAAAILAEAREELQATTTQCASAQGRAPRAQGDVAQEDDEMSPDGIALAEGAADRDGLEMDEIHLPLGPVLAHWPAGVVLRLTLHGDVVAAAEVDYLGAAGPGPAQEDGPTRAARLLDAAASVLLLAGLSGDAARARRLREDCLDTTPVDGRAIEALRRRIQRHRVLAWSLGGLAVSVEGERSETLHDCLVDLLGRARDAVEGQLATALPRGPSLACVPASLRGQELAAVRLWMAAWSADLTDVAREETAHG